ncbi:hypothetical protein HPB51_000080 [Rhipicephalus microplus]|uniref:Uncharacterized protein n=1 Tax=Rhipicephalus microplus TaxID=6941 RepID=A0A9J6DRY9_RHIMP|nr:hypothetical protein HPB51_000080 [Rhipicephalus microplus]
MLSKEKFMMSQVKAERCRLKTTCRFGRGLRATSVAGITYRTRRPTGTLMVILDLRRLWTEDVRCWLRSSSSVFEDLLWRIEAVARSRDDEATAQLTCHRILRAPPRPGVEWWVLSQRLKFKIGWNSSSSLQVQAGEPALRKNRVTILLASDRNGAQVAFRNVSVCFFFFFFSSPGSLYPTQ